MPRKVKSATVANYLEELDKFLATERMQSAFTYSYEGIEEEMRDIVRARVKRDFTRTAVAASASV